MKRTIDMVTMTSCDEARHSDPRTSDTSTDKLNNKDFQCFPKITQLSPSFPVVPVCTNSSSTWDPLDIDAESKISRNNPRAKPRDFTTYRRPLASTKRRTVIGITTVPATCKVSIKGKATQQHKHQHQRTRQHLIHPTQQPCLMLGGQVAALPQPGALAAIWIALLQRPENQATNDGH